MRIGENMRRLRSEAQRRRRGVLVRNLQLHVVRADFLETQRHDALRQVGFVAFAAEVREEQMAEAAAHDVGGAVGGGLIRQMAVPAKNPLLQAPGPAGTVLQHLHIVIGFQHEHIRLTDALGDDARDVAEVGGKADVARSGAQEEAHRVLRIVRQRERLDREVADFKARAGGEQPEFGAHAGDTFDFVLGGAIAVNGQVQFVRESFQAGDVITVLMGDENGREIFRRAADAGQALADLSHAESRVHQHARLAGFNITAVAGGAAAEDREFDCHPETLGPGAQGGNAFLQCSGWRMSGSELRLIHGCYPATEPDADLTMKSATRLLVVLTCLPGLFTARADLLDQFRSLTKGTNQTSLATAALAQSDVIDGLKQALGNGVQQAVTRLGSADGFLTNLAVRIPMPEKLRSAEKTLRAIGQEKLADDFIASMNHAAEQAVPVAASVFGDAIKQMSIEDAKGILSGTNNAATQFFRRTTETNLYGRFYPIVQHATEQVGVTASYKQMVGKLGNAGGLGGLFGGRSKALMQTADLDAYVTQKGLDGLFAMVAEEEKRIRENPAARTSELLKKVFGAVGK